MKERKEKATAVLFGLYGGVVGIVKTQHCPCPFWNGYRVPGTVLTALHVAFHGQLPHVVLVFSILKRREWIIWESKTSYSVSEKQR